MGDVDSGYQRLEDQISWYDSKSMLNQRLFKWLKIFEISCAVMIPIQASKCPVMVALLGAAIIILEAAQHIWQYQHNWITYRSTCEALKHEKFLYLAKAQEYELPEEEARKRLAERVEALVSTEHAKWIINSNKISNKSKDAH